MNTFTMAAAVVVFLISICIGQAVALIRQWNTIDRLREKVATRDGIIDEKSVAVHESEQAALNLRKQCDNLIVENARLRQLVAEKTEYAEDLARDLGLARSHGICGVDAPTRIGCTSMRPVCALRLGHASLWHEGDDGSRWKKGTARVVSRIKAVPSLRIEQDDPRPEFWSCGTEGHTKVEWRGNVAHCADCGCSSADVVDEDVTRPYTEAYEAGDGR